MSFTPLRVLSAPAVGHETTAGAALTATSHMGRTSSARDVD
ncbi:hypothetical protein [Actinoallomurus sp. NPDC050550]